MQSRLSHQNHPRVKTAGSRNSLHPNRSGARRNFLVVGRDKDRSRNGTRYRAVRKRSGGVTQYRGIPTLAIFAAAALSLALN
jgi:hypothetical protein